MFLTTCGRILPNISNILGKKRQYIVNILPIYIAQYSEIYWNILQYQYIQSRNIAISISGYSRVVQCIANYCLKSPVWLGSPKAYNLMGMDLQKLKTTLYFSNITLLTNTIDPKFKGGHFVFAGILI